MSDKNKLLKHEIRRCEISHIKKLFHDRNLSLLTQKRLPFSNICKAAKWEMVWSSLEDWESPVWHVDISPIFIVLYCMAGSFPKFRQLLVMTVWGLQDIGYQSSDTIIISLAHSLLCCKYQDHYCLTEKTPTNKNLILQLSPVLWISVLNTQILGEEMK